ncbi:RelA/SpoT family protein [Microbacterium indicum]|uniref:RelA/SpoT family protein n=1 Tax=Microbacterium indicum TaxID=358100 RepID=UPI000424C292|nr:bifunctional (p)ppGpp synthetase/guanosine-3',5'-bis(diphosphate) 3'-pyrophosphohydrolase [Microbacterium indicum]
MADALSTSAGPSLRWLVPRIFTRAKPNADLQKLLQAVRASNPRADLSIVEKAYTVAEEKHRGQKRQSGEPYITHPLAVAQILAEMGLGPRAIAAALLHDTVEDTGYPLEELTQEFGDEVALLVDGVTKLDKVKYGDSAQAETVRKMIVAMSKDVRVLVIKLADRLHNARTWGFVPPEKAKKKATETLEIYAPLAHRLGISTIKSELEDLSFAVLYPKIYNEIDSLVKQRTPQREQYVTRVIGEVNEDLAELRIRGTVSGRPKQLYSVYQKMVVRGREFDDIYDLIGIRVIVGTVRDCYAVLGALHARWTPLPGRFKDYIATPKFNLYRSLHTTVIGPGGRTVEIQIRTEEMHHQAEYGVAAHWKYKERMAATGGRTDERASNEDMAWIARLSDWQAETKDPGEFLDSLRFEIGAKEVYVFTPKGRVIGLPKGATPVDFAFAVHTEIGYRTMGAKVNGRLVPLESELQSGDVVEVFTSKNPDAGPSADWLAFVKSTRARNKIRGWFTKERREEAIEQGKEGIARAMRRLNMPFARLKDSLPDVAAQLHYDDVSALYAAVGEGHVSPQSVLEKVQSVAAEEATSTGAIDLPPTASSRAPRTGDSGVLVRGAPDILVKLAKCCTPVPGDEIVGFVTRGSGVSVHRADCTNVKALGESPERMIDVEWAPTTRAVFLVQIQVEALDRGGLLSDITSVLSEHHVNILSASVQTTKSRLAISRYVFEMGDTVHLDRVLSAVRRIEGVYDVYRVTSG